MFPFIMLIDLSTIAVLLKRPEVSTKGWHMGQIKILLVLKIIIK